MNEHRSKISTEVAQEIENDIQALRDSIAQNDADKMKECVEKVKNGAMKIGQAMYANQGQSQQQDQQQQQSQEGGEQQQQDQNQQNK